MNTSPLKAMFWKECRENSRWAVLALLALSLGLAYAWYRLPPGPVLGQIWSGENLVLTITTPLVGLALGLLQILPELRRDQWAFLVHRPASRTALFFGKVLPGVCLYLLATALPLLGLAAWAASPSHVPAPFDFRFTLAGWAAILAGLPFYFAGLLVALRPARWYGSRALPILTALLAPFAAGALHEFWQTALVSLLALAVLLCAAWGSFLSGGEYKEQTKPARFALGLALYPAVLTVAIGALLLSATVWNTAFRSKTSFSEWWRTDYNVDTQGRVFEIATHQDKQGKTHETVTDLAGRPVDPRVWENLNQQHKLLDFVGLPHGDLDQQEYYRYSDPTCYVLDLTSTGNDTHQTYWYYETAAHQIVGYTVHQIVGYPVPAQTPTITGYLGPKGFGRDPEQAGRFEGARPDPIGFAGLHLLRFLHALYRYDPSASIPSIRLLQPLPGGSGGTTLLRNANDTQVLIVAAGDRLTAYTSGAPQAPTKLFTTPLAFDPKPYPDIQVAMTSDRSHFFFWYQPRPLPGAGHLVTVASNGRVLKTEAMPPANQTGAATKMRFIQALPALIMPPAAVTAFALYNYIGYIGHGLGRDSAEGFWDPLTTIGPMLFFSVLGGLLAAVPAWLISRRLGDGRRGQLAWALGGFWLGGYGVLLLLALRAWPARVPCPNCGRARVVDNEVCEHCGAAWARPQRDGTEIFDAETREAEPTVGS